MNKLSIIVPVYNERKTILEVLGQIKNVDVGMDKEVIVVDDGSTDGSRDLLKNLSESEIIIVLKEHNEGKGAALKTGIARATGTYIIFQDADLEYNPTDYPALLDPFQDNNIDLVLGSRVLSGSMNLFGDNKAHIGSYLGCKIIACTINILYGRRFSDYYGCYKAFRSHILKNIPVESNGFDYDSELLCKLLKQDVRAVEVPSSYTPRKHTEGKKLSFIKDGLRVMYSILHWRFRN